MTIEMKKVWFVDGQIIEQEIPESDIYKQEPVACLPLEDRPDDVPLVLRRLYSLLKAEYTLCVPFGVLLG